MKRTTGIRALLSKARTFMFDLECPYCHSLITNEDETMSFSIHETQKKYIKCGECGKTSRTPKRVFSQQIETEE